MADGSLVLEVLGEDAGHRLFAEEVIGRMARERGYESVRVITDTGGGVEGVRKTLRARAKDGVPRRGEMLVVLVDANRRGWHERRNEFAPLVEAAGDVIHALGCPEPYIEAWCLLDPGAWQRAFGRVPTFTANTTPKQVLADAAIEVAQLDPVRMTIVRALAPHFDFERMSRDRSFKDFYGQIKVGLDRLLER